MADADDIREQMKNIRRGMGAEVKGLVQGAQQLSDWRYHVRKHPWACVGSAFLLGLFAAPKRRAAGRAELEKLMAQFHESNPAGSAQPSHGLLMKVLGIAGPIAARGAAQFVANRFGGAKQAPSEDDPRDTTFEQVSKPR